MLTYLLIAGALSGVFSGESRRLIIEGETTEVNEYPYVVSLMYCKYSLQGLSCASFCSGSLVAPDVVLTAGHCVFNEEDSGFNHSLPAVPLNSMYALIGADDWQQLPSGSRLVKVSSVSNAGYGTNKRFPMDDDVGLVFLADCVSPVAGLIGYVPIATRTTEESTSNKEQCRFITSLGFGTHSNVPSEIFSHDGKLRVLVGDSLHSHEACRESFVDALQRADAEPDEIAVAALEISAAKHLCAGGDTVASTCFGDSGGPVVLNDAVIGVTSFGPYSVCMASPDYIARVSTYAEWIRYEMEAKSRHCAAVKDSFTSWPLPVVKDESVDRCRSGQWQCEKSAECIPESAVCDRTVDCKDGSDEEPYFCRVEYIKFPFGRPQPDRARSGLLNDAGLRNDLGAALKLSDKPSKADEIEAEFNQLLFGATENLKFFANGKTVSGGYSEVEGREVTVSVVGMLFSVSRKTRRLGASRRTKPRSTADAGPAILGQIRDSCKAGLATIEEDLNSCISEMRSLAVQLEYEVKHGQNRFETEPEPVLSHCASYKKCIEELRGETFYDWFSAGDLCVMLAEDPDAFSPVVAGQWGLVQFCGDTVEEFVAMNATKIEYAEKFARQFREPICHLPRDLSSAKAKPKFTSGTWQGATYSVALCIFIVQQWL